MADPYAVFRAHPNKHASLEILWPALFEALGGGAGGKNPDAPPPAVYCAVYRTHPIGAGKVEAAYRTPAGHPVCPECAAKWEPHQLRRLHRKTPS